MISLMCSCKVLEPELECGHLQLLYCFCFSPIVHHGEGATGGSEMLNNEQLLHDRIMRHMSSFYHEGHHARHTRMTSHVVLQPRK
jgi:hypothetical protein